MRDPVQLVLRALRSWGGGRFTWAKSCSLFLALCGGLTGFVLADAGGAVVGFLSGGLGGFVVGAVVDRWFW